MAEPPSDSQVLATPAPGQEPPAPDIMNDPQFATNTGGGEDGLGDADTCRICRGEGGDSEPLFHPCKCSGSIKYVHQDCLMEWLSHSQKKHCELCKTPFRFTKLYSPNMPQSLPFHVLIRHVIIHIAKNLATWLRACLVIVVWLACLPYIIRQVWRLLFWMSDGGWPTSYSRMMDPFRNATSIQALEMAREFELSTLSGNGTTPSTPFHPAPTTSASYTGLVNKLVSFLSPISQTLNISGSDPLAAGLFKSLKYGFGIQSVVIPENQADNATITLYPLRYTPPSSPSLLGDVSFLKNLTRNATVNDAIINIAEGYIITILVVVCFILVFLIREWVVQQQPGINMGAGFNAEFAAAQPNIDRPRRNAAAVRAREENQNQIQMPQDGVRERPIARPRRRNNRAGEVDEAPLQRNDTDQNVYQNVYNPAQGENGGPSTSGRPSPPRDALSPAAEIQRRLTEEPRHTEEFLAIWRRADSDPQEVLRIIERENKGDDMRYWVNAMNVLQTPVALGNGRLRPNASDDDNDHDSIRATASDRAVQAENGGSSASSESWVDIRQPLEAQQTPLTEDNLTQHREDLRLLKGKGRATVEFDNQSSETPAALQSRTNLPSQNLLSDNSLAFAPGPSRPRAISDGPQRKENISPLANNNWSFSNLSDEETSPTRETSTAAHTMQNETINDADFDPSDLVPLRSLLSPEAEAKLASSLQPAEPSAHTDSAPGTQNVEASLLQMLEGEVPELPIYEEDHVPVTGQDDIGRSYQALEDAFPANPAESDSENDLGEQNEAPEANPFEPDIPLPALQEPLLPEQADVPAVEPQDAPNARPAAPQGLLGHVADFLWGGVGDDQQIDQGGNDEQIVQDIAAEAPFVPVAHHDVFEQPDAPFVEQDREVVEAAIAAGIDPNDQEAIDDAEDFEGIMELVGMRGPIFSLVQNALFSAFLLALAVAIGVWIPYNIGRVSLLLVANPGPTLKLPLRLVYGCIALLQDLSLSIMGMVSYLLITVCSWTLGLFYSSTGNGDTARGLGSAAMKLSQNSAGRIVNGTLNNFGHIHESEIFAFSAASHESLITIKSYTIDSVAGLGASVRYLFTGSYSVTWQGFLSATISGLKYVWHLIASIPGVLARPDSWVISLESPKRVVPLDLELSIWDGWDRFWAIFGGYAALCILGALYVKKGSPFSTGQQGRDWEASIIDLLNQAGGVMKVILIISIEMLVFPLYCGLLLDAALLPLFDNATIMSRILFTFNSPFTSLFVHWFVGTCYMFHFALFVSMCRKIMRKGVLYFIRDPDDPTFHPVRDVLERNVATQLRKIMFSALVYGALVVVCLGGVVWGLAFAFKGVLPIHWSSNEPVLEFPIDLLFYNFLMPMAVRFFKPSDGLHSMYSWWFRQCARMLRLTWFMFDERKLDEEGYHVRKHWMDVFRGVKGDPKIPVRTKDRYKPFKEDPELNAYFRLDGKYVRAPASDQVRIPKGISIFLEVDSTNRRIDGKAERPNGVHSKTSDLYKQVYIPPFFRFRICLFILFIWLFAAATGVGITIVPLVFGRQIFGKLIPPHVRKNDVYAFSIGIYILGSALYAILNLRKFITYLRNALAVNAETPQNVLRRVTKITTRVASIAWTYTAFLFILPTLFAFLVEFYFIVPLHTYFSLEERHVVHFVQSWTLGLLYVKLTTRLILWHADSRPAQSLRRITRNGYLNPDARLATRSFILPATAALSTALAVPWLLAEFATRTALRAQPEKHIMAYRYAYPMCLALACVGIALWHILGMVKKWRMMIRDEVYLIGERLHNFGDRKVVSPGIGPSPVRRLDT